MLKYVSFEKVLEWLGAGYHGPTLQHWIEVILGEEDAEPEYTVYWPKDSIRVIPGSSYAVAVVVRAILADPETRNMGEPTNPIPGVIARMRRDLHHQKWSSAAQARSATEYVKDRILTGDISNIRSGRVLLELTPTNVKYRLDMTTIPGN